MEDVPCTYRISVKALIKHADKVLLIKEADGSWELPGGGLEHGEDPRQALAREIEEETGFNVDWMGESPETFWTINKEVGSPTLKWFAFVVYEAKVSGEFKPDLLGGSDTAHEVGYFSREDARALQLHANTSPYFAS